MPLLGLVHRVTVSYHFDKSTCYLVEMSKFDFDFNPNGSPTALDLKPNGSPPTLDLNAPLLEHVRNKHIRNSGIEMSEGPLLRLGCGSSGCVYRIANGVAIKITADAAETACAFALHQMVSSSNYSLHLPVIFHVGELDGAQMPLWLHPDRHHSKAWPVAPAGCYVREELNNVFPSDLFPLHQHYDIAKERLGYAPETEYEYERAMYPEVQDIIEATAVKIEEESGVKLDDHLLLVNWGVRRDVENPPVELVFRDLHCMT